MLLQISTTHSPATDLGFLLAKNPERAQSFNLSFGRAHAFYPEANSEKCSFALLLDVDTVALSRGKNGRKRGDSAPLQPYVNDRPYVASSFLSVAIAQVLRSALSGTSRERTELAQTAIPLEAHISSVPCGANGEELLRRLFEPLGYVVETEGALVDERFPDWGASPSRNLTLRQTIRLSDLLTHLYVLIPVLDDEKHYFVGDDEVEKLLKRGEGWLESHPERELIVSRYLKRRRVLIDEALRQLAPEMAFVDEDVPSEKAVSLHQARLDCVLETLKNSGAKRVLDLGCGEGRLLRALLSEKQFERIVGLDASHRALEIAGEKLRLEQMPDAKRARIELWHGALTYRDKRLEGFDAAAIVEVVEHLDPHRLRAFERVVWEFARPDLVVLSTPNRDYNVMWETLGAGKMRHRDHRFEWTRDEFREWVERVANENGYEVEIQSLGPVDEAVGAPSQMAIFRRKTDAGN